VEDRCAVVKGGGEREMRQGKERDGVGDRCWRDTRVVSGGNKWSTWRGEAVVRGFEPRWGGGPSS
jgi:hypothetical protein